MSNLKPRFLEGKTRHCPNNLLMLLVECTLLSPAEKSAEISDGGGAAKGALFTF
jgi:hypothetical protein